MRRLALAALLLSACAPSTFPGTRIPDNEEYREVLAVLSRFKGASEALDAPAVLALAAPQYFDAGVPGRGGQRDLATLQAQLPAHFQKLKGLKMDITIKDARIERDRAEVDYFVVLHYAIGLPQGGERWYSESDDARMTMVRINGQWKALSGL